MTIRIAEKDKIKLLNMTDVFSIMKKILLREKKIDRNKEHLWVICLANNNRILLVELISLGTVNSAIAEPMDVFSFALQKRAVKLVLVHNHPSGDLYPTQADMAFTERMLVIGKFVRVPVIDHLIISETDFFSFAAEGLLRKIEKETPHDLTFKEIDKAKALAEARVRDALSEAEARVKNAEIKAADEVAEVVAKAAAEAAMAAEAAEVKKDHELLKKREEIAKKMLARKTYSAEEISELTGLTKEQVEGLRIGQ